MKREGEGDDGQEDDNVDFEYNEIDEEEDDDGYEFTPDDAMLRSDLHVIYRRRNSQLDHSSDYRE